MADDRQSQVTALPEPNKLLSPPTSGSRTFCRDSYALLEEGTSWAIPGWGIRNAQSLGGIFMWATFTMGLAGVPEVEAASDSVTGCVMTFNSARTIELCLASLRKAVNEIIVLDSGSTDETVEIARRYTDNIHHVPWPGYYAAQRNNCLNRVKTDWAILLDSDEFFEVGIASALPRLIGWSNANGVDIVWQARQWITAVGASDGNSIEIEALRGHWLYWPDPQVRLIRMSTGDRFVGIVHSKFRPVKSRRAALAAHASTTAYHLNLITVSLEERRAIVAERQRKDPTPMAALQLLPEDSKLARKEKKPLALNAPAHAAALEFMRTIK